jgi:hypothetical protein
MKHLGTISRLLTVAASLAVLSAAPVAAGRPGSTVKPTTAVGNDISWPQCSTTLPTTHAFGIVGVNGGLATTTNPCLAIQLQWAYRAVGGTSQPIAQLYVNTANPGEIIDQVQTWPVNNIDPAGFNTTSTNPYGVCGGQNDLACSWQYGWNRAVNDVIEKFVPAARTAGVNADPAGYTWWLDVETGNTWQSGSPEALARNAATLEGMTAHFQSKGGKVGIYSTNYQWGVIAGTNVGATGNLAGLDSWLAGARNLRGAQSNCSKPSLTTGGRVTLTQYVSGDLDYDYSCVK